MMARRVRALEFRIEELDPVLGEMDRLGTAHGGWINFHPAVPEEDEPPPPRGLGALFSSATYEVPVCTWVAGKLNRHGVEPDSLGVQHAAGPKSVRRLVALGIPLPDGWRAVQDHPRRGLVVRPVPGATHAEELSWLLEVGTALSVVRLTGTWTAEVHEAA